MPPRAISILCLLQVAALIGSRLLSGAWIHAVLSSPPGQQYKADGAWNDLLIFSRWGIWPLLLLPATCMVLSARFSATHRGMALVEDWCFWIALGVTIGVTVYGIVIVNSAFIGPGW